MKKIISERKQRMEKNIPPRRYKRSRGRGYIRYKSKFNEQHFTVCYAPSYEKPRWFKKLIRKEIEDGKRKFLERGGYEGDFHDWRAALDLSYYAADGTFVPWHFRSNREPRVMLCEWD